MLIIVSTLILLLAFSVVFLIAKYDIWVHKDKDFEYPNYYQQVAIQYEEDFQIKHTNAVLIPTGDKLIWKAADKNIDDEQVIAWSYVKYKS